MKLIPSAFVTVILLAFNASAQPSSPSPAAPRMPPGLAQRMPPGHPPVEPAGPPPPLPDKDKLSYAIGYGIGTSIKRDLFEVDVDSLAAAMKDVLADRPTRLSQKEVDDVMAQFRKALPAYMASQNKLKGEQFLAQNAKAPGITVLSNGLQYKVLKEGSGEMPKTNDTVVVNYKGTLIDGTVFDQRDGFTNRVTGQTIKGWSEILPLMKTGSNACSLRQASRSGRSLKASSSRSSTNFCCAWLNVTTPILRFRSSGSSARRRISATTARASGPLGYSK